MRISDWSSVVSSSDLDREIAREATASRLRIGLRRAGEADKVVIDQAAGRQVGRRRTPDRMPELAGKGLGGKGLAVRITVADRDIAKPRPADHAGIAALFDAGIGLGGVAATIQRTARSAPPAVGDGHCYPRPPPRPPPAAA